MEGHGVLSQQPSVRGAVPEARQGREGVGASQEE